MKLNTHLSKYRYSSYYHCIGLTSCDYLDVVPPNNPISMTQCQAPPGLWIPLFCYGGVGTDLPSAYLGEINSTTDEYVLALFMEHRWLLGAMHLTLHHPLTKTCGNFYQYIGQCYLFLQKLENAGSDIASDAEKEQWRAECQFLVAYYHFATLRRWSHPNYRLVHSDGYPNVRV